MQVTYERCAGLDVHPKTVSACTMVSNGDVRPEEETQTFGTMTDDLLRLSDWLMSKGVTHVAMESTGVYWQPVFNILEANFEVILVNARHVKTVPGRKTDIKDCQWLCDLLRHGLLKASFIPPEPIRDLRELTRYRKSLIHERSREASRLRKSLESANIKLQWVASDVLGVSGRMMLQGLLEGSTDASDLANLALGKLREKRTELERALRGRVKEHHRFLVAEQLCHLDFLDQAIKRVGEEIARQMSPFQEAVERLKTIPGVSDRVAEVIVAEIGVDMSRFPTAHHLASWAGMCPGNNQSGGRRRNAKTRKGDTWLRTVLVEAAWAVSRGRTMLSAQYHRLAARRGKKRAIMAVAHSILVIAYYLISRGRNYDELGADYYEQRDREQIAKRLVKRLQKLDYKVTIEEANAA